MLLARVRKNSVRILLKDWGFEGSRNGKALGQAVVAAAAIGREDIVEIILRTKHLSFRMDKILGPSLVLAAVGGNMKKSIFRNIPVVRIIDTVHADGSTALHYATRYGFEDVVRLLLQSGADFTIKDNDGFTPLLLAATLGASSIDLLNSTTSTNSGNHPVTESDLNYLKWELGLGLGDQLTAARRKIENRSDGISDNIYDCCLSALAKANHLPDLAVGKRDILSDSDYVSQIPQWSDCLPSAMFRLVFKCHSSVLLRLDSFLGMGDCHIGQSIIERLIQIETLGTRKDRHCLQDFVQVTATKDQSQVKVQQILAWMLALVQAICDNEVMKIRSLDCQPSSVLSKGSCWRDAYGNVLEIHLAFSNTDVGLPYSKISQDLLPDLALSTLEDLRSALGIYTVEKQGEVHCLYGHYGICILIGVLSESCLPLWHTCSIEEASFLISDQEGFAEVVKSMREQIPCLQDQYEVEESSLETGMILLGALLNPGWYDGALKSRSCPSASVSIRKSRVQTPQTRLRLDRITGQAQLSMGA